MRRSLVRRRRARAGGREAEASAPRDSLPRGVPRGVRRTDCIDEQTHAPGRRACHVRHDTVALMYCEERSGRLVWHRPSAFDLGGGGGGGGGAAR